MQRNRNIENRDKVELEENVIHKSQLRLCDCCDFGSRSAAPNHREGALIDPLGVVSSPSTPPPPLSPPPLPVIILVTIPCL